MPTMHSNLGELHPGRSRVLHEPRRPPSAKGLPTHLTVAFPGRELHIELFHEHRALFAGFWETEISLDGEPAFPAADYEETCWVADRDVNYLELEIHLGGGLRLERHLVFAREEQLVFLADAVFGPRSGKWHYRGSLPLAEGMRFQADRQHAEGAIRGKKRLATVLPPALPEWQSADGSGHLRQQGQKLELAQTAVGRNLFAPLLIDLKTRRFGKPLTWRQLTVAGSQEILPLDSAVGYRVMIGKEQWLIYRSLSPRANRTLLGHNLTSEFLLARFLKSGEVETLIEVE
ncbi:MAG: hypothetical protein IT426_10990 [Pirellulales bacterium]|nr:hypothetical protein [Pirellulales bacterium]